MLQCGFYEMEITPHIGGNMPGYFDDRHTVRVWDPLYVHAFASRGKDSTFMILSIDSLVIEEQDANRIREGISAATKIPTGNISMAAIHTHTGGACTELYGGERDEAYCDFLCKRAIDTGIMAFLKLEDAKIGLGTRKVENIAFNRRYFMKDGSVVSNPGLLNPEIDRPADVADDEFLLLRVDRADGSPMGVILNFGLHTDTVFPVPEFGYSADFPGLVRRNMRKKFGEDFGFLFLQGACGNVNSLDITKKWEEQHNYQSLGNVFTEIAMQVYEQTALYDTDLVRCVVSEVTGYTRRPTQEEYDRQAKNPYLQRVMKPVLELPSEEVKMQVWTGRIGDTYIQMLPGELFAWFGIEVKKQTDYGHTLVSELSNSSIGYIYTREAQTQDAYESIPTTYIKMDGETGYKILDAADCNVKKLKENKEE